MAKTYVSLSYSERLVIEQLLKQDFGIRSVAKALGRSPSSISSETRRNGMTAKTYSARRAQNHATFVRISSKPKEKMYGALEAMVLQLLTEVRCSPAQISGYLKKRYPNQAYLHISHQTIYSYIKDPYRADLLRRYLRRKGRKRRSRALYAKRERIKNMKLIDQRPQEVEQREIVGHWEGDLVIGKNNGSAIGTLVERSSRYTIVVPLQDRTSNTVTQAFIDALKKLPAHMRKSLTYDQGIEMAYHEKLTKELDMPVYFAQPASPWQRGSNENTNGLLREFFPKKTDLAKYSERAIHQVQDILNQRPRAVLGFSSPSTIMAMLVKNPNLTLPVALK